MNRRMTNEKKNDAIQSDAPKSSDESWAEYKDEGTSPVNFDNESQKSL